MATEKKLIGQKKFVLENNLNPECKCICDIKIELDEYDNNKWYYCSFNFEYEDENSKKANPFFDNPAFFDNGEDKTEIIVKNSLSRKLIQFVLMDYDELSKISGHSTPQHYKKVIMNQILLLWD